VGDEYSQFLSKYFIEAFEKGGGTIVAAEAFRSGELDFRAQLGKSKPVNQMSSSSPPCKRSRVSCQTGTRPGHHR